MEMLFLDQWLLYIRECISMIGVMVIVGGAIRSLYQLVMLTIKQAFDINYIRLEFGNSVILGLEFMVGADIIGSLVAPDYYNLGLLAIIVVVRTILSYFLTMELQSLTPQQRNAIK
jgi:Predicted membrane protein